MYNACCADPNRKPWATGECNVKPFHWPQSRPAAGRSTARSLRSLRLPVARRQEPDRDHPQCKSQCGRAASRAIYRLNIDNDGDYLTDIALSYVFSKPQNGRQTVNVFMATGSQARSDEAAGKKIIADGEVSFGARPNIIRSDGRTFFAGSRSDAFFFDFDGIKNLFDIRGKRNFTEPHLGGKSPWTGVDSNTQANVFSTVIELPTSELAPKPEMHIWGRCSVRRDGKLLHVDRAGHPSVSSFFNTDDTKEEYNASEPVNDRKRWLDQFVHLMGH